MDALAGARTDYDTIRETLTSGESLANVGKQISAAWVAQYKHECQGETELVEVDVDSLTYVFDVVWGRAVGVYGTSASTNEVRPKSRIGGHPSYDSAKRQTDRGHLAAHTIGGGADINLVAQDHAMNVAEPGDALSATSRRIPEHSSPSRSSTPTTKIVRLDSYTQSYAMANSSTSTSITANRQDLAALRPGFLGWPLRSTAALAVFTRGFGFFRRRRSATTAGRAVLD